ncbi:cytochrome c biogenesis protein CcdA [Gloeobacter kilaueensis]|uniref:Cytochrome c biogenesis protein transmembrane region n=1 Tax=Gloeobacter kilaueensis (strain ATCC BAA-2537 / CCAP 1431/1 / ULC 316 / JS1) TaxID=1183438 RepID=U5QPE2_GLOK1|nr:cytochrome c biogenesis protein CcdA [Gloeobacter kilaueensis]AGY59545.1 cytochrome c biogenesis protein transmembrane region [Gloeobacter kilaueensis JS1]
MSESLQLWFYQLQQGAEQLAKAQLGQISPLSFLLLYAIGLATSFTPCILSMLPVTIGYIGGYQSRSRSESLIQSAWFALGLAVTMTSLGLVATLPGVIYGQVGTGWFIAMGALAILMGLNLLGLIPIRLPQWGGFDFDKDTPQWLKSLLTGLTFGLVASPCSTPVLLSLLGWVSTTGNPLVGVGLLFAYSLGHATPLVLAGAFTGALKALLSLRRWSGLINQASGVLLIFTGTIAILNLLHR